MKTCSPFLALVKLEIARSISISANPVSWALVLVLVTGNVGSALLLWLRPETSFFLIAHEGWASVLVGWWLYLLTMECSNALGRGMNVFSPFGVATGNRNEFLSSRAIDRSLHFRAKTTVLAVFIVLPMLFNFVLICLVARQYPPGIGDYMEATHVSTTEAASVATATAFAWAMIWGGSAIIVAVQAYFGLLSKWGARRGQWWLSLMTNVPVWLLLVALFSGAFASDVIELTVRCFAQHWLLLTLTLLALALPVQRFCERRFAEQEVL